MVDLIRLENLYTSYDFTATRESNACPVFLYKKSRYFGVDILLLDNMDEHAVGEAQKVSDKYSKIGYAVNIKRISSNEEAENELFKSFFNFEGTIERLKRKYSEFSNKQTKALLGSKYEYVESPFEIYNNIDQHDTLFGTMEKLFTSESAELILIEAAAGYGKTCTAYEILRRNIDKTGNQIPIFTELSRNRSAKIFRYILLDEIDLEYPSLNSQLVIREIKSGRIPLIIDGFDELLIKVQSDVHTNDSFEDVESMLDTIGSLLEQKTKVVLTTRKTAIFTGYEFETWIAKWKNKFNTTRIGIKEPRLKDWLGESKYDHIKANEVPVENLANPVILSFLKNASNDEFVELVLEPQKLVTQYFERMLERERDRQNLIMTVQRQLEVFRNVVRMFIELDTTMTDKSFLKEIILDENKKIIEYTRTMYSPVERPTTDQLVDTLSNHALLDAKGRDKDQVGFINDFVFGILIGQIMSETSPDRIEKEFSPYMVEIAVTAYRVQSPGEKDILWQKVQPILHKFQMDDVFTFDIYLQSRLKRDYKEMSVSETSFFGVTFQDFTISSSVFINCRFKRCQFESKYFRETSFINCHFEDCYVLDTATLDYQNDLIFIKCSQESSNIFKEELYYQEGDPHAYISDFEKKVLQQLWSISNTKGQHVVKLMRSFPDSQRRDVGNSLKWLEERNLITIHGSYIHYVINKIHLIREILEL